MRYKIYFLIIIYFLQFDLTIVGIRNNQREGGVEGGLVYFTIMFFQDMFDYCIRNFEQVGLVRGFDSVFYIFWFRGNIFFFNFVEDLYELLMVKGKGKEYSKNK